MLNRIKHISKCVLRLTLPMKCRVVLKAKHRRILSAFKKHRILRLIPTLEPLESKNSPKYIVSLTSYKKRLIDTAPYAIITLLNQSIKPNKVVLWVAHEDKEVIPDVLHKLTEKGLEIRFCEDMKSYKKLIPALQEFPEDYIITADDDFYYHRDWFAQLKELHLKSPKKIICHRAHGIKVDENHNPLPYDEWDYQIEPSVYFARDLESQSSHQYEAIFPTGGAGTLYPPRCLSEKVNNEELFMKLTPQADDIWFWAMAVLNKEYFGCGSPYLIVSFGYSGNFQIVDFRQTQDQNALFNYNIKQDGNDKQLKAIVEYFPEIKEYLKKIPKSKLPDEKVSNLS